MKNQETKWIMNFNISETKTFIKETLRRWDDAMQDFSDKGLLEISNYISDSFADLEEILFEMPLNKTLTLEKRNEIRVLVKYTEKAMML